MYKNSREDKWLIPKKGNENTDKYTWNDLMEECANFESKEDFEKVCAKNSKIKIYFNVLSYGF